MCIAWPLTPLRLCLQNIFPVFFPCVDRIQMLASIQCCITNLAPLKIPLVFRFSGTLKFELNVTLMPFIFSYSGAVPCSLSLHPLVEATLLLWVGKYYIVGFLTTFVWTIAAVLTAPGGPRRAQSLEHCLQLQCLQCLSLLARVTSCQMSAFFFFKQLF